MLCQSLRIHVFAFSTHNDHPTIRLQLPSIHNRVRGCSIMILSTNRSVLYSSFVKLLLLWLLLMVYGLLCTLCLGEKKENSQCDIDRQNLKVGISTPLKSAIAKQTFDFCGFFSKTVWIARRLAADVSHGLHPTIKDVADSQKKLSPSPFYSPTSRHHKEDSLDKDVIYLWHHWYSQYWSLGFPRILSVRLQAYTHWLQKSH